MPALDGKPFYRLSEIQACVDAAPHRVRMRREAKADARDFFGYGVEDVVEVLRGLNESDLHKPLALEAYQGEVADVYRVELDDNLGAVYLKFMIDGDNILRVLSFKPWHESRRR